MHEQRNHAKPEEHCGAAAEQYPAVEEDFIERCVSGLLFAAAGKTASEIEVAILKSRLCNALQRHGMLGASRTLLYRMSMSGWWPADFRPSRPRWFTEAHRLLRRSLEIRLADNLSLNEFPAIQRLQSFSNIFLAQNGHGSLRFPDLFVLYLSRREVTRACCVISPCRSSQSRSGRLSYTSTTFGSNCVPEQRMISLRASSKLPPLR